VATLLVLAAVLILFPFYAFILAKCASAPVWKPGG
jgi:hypothetical protein